MRIGDALSSSAMLVVCVLATIAALWMMYDGYQQDKANTVTPAQACEYASEFAHRIGAKLEGCGCEARPYKARCTLNLNGQIGPWECGPGFCEQAVSRAKKRGSGGGGLNTYYDLSSGEIKHGIGF